LLFLLHLKIKWLKAIAKLFPMLAHQVEEVRLHKLAVNLVVELKPATDLSELLSLLAKIRFQAILALEVMTMKNSLAIKTMTEAKETAY
jgi:HEAT repeat protein